MEKKNKFKGLIIGEYRKIVTNFILPSDKETDFYKNAVFNNYSYRN